MPTVFPSPKARCTMPPKHKMLGFFGENDNKVVRITFNKPNSEVLVNDFVKYSFLLTNEYLPKTYNDYLTFDKYINSKNISKNDLLAVVRRDKFDKVREDNNFLEVNNKIQNSYADIFDFIKRCYGKSKKIVNLIFNVFQNLPRRACTRGR